MSQYQSDFPRIVNSTRELLRFGRSKGNAISGLRNILRTISSDSCFPEQMLFNIGRNCFCATLRPFCLLIVVVVDIIRSKTIQGHMRPPTVIPILELFTQLDQMICHFSSGYPEGLDMPEDKQSLSKRVSRLLLLLLNPLPENRHLHFELVDLVFQKWDFLVFGVGIHRSEVVWNSRCTIRHDQGTLHKHPTSRQKIRCGSLGCSIDAAAVKLQCLAVRKVDRQSVRKDLFLSRPNRRHNGYRQTITDPFPPIRRHLCLLQNLHKVPF